MPQIRFPTLPAQMALLKSRKPLAIYVGGVGSGKTRGAVYKSTDLGVMNAPCFGIFVEPTYAMIRDVAIRSFQEVYEQYEVPYELHKSESIIRVADSFDILLRSGDQPERLFGLNAAWGGIDEPASQAEEVPKIVLQRLRDPRAKFKQLFMTGTPSGFNWFYHWAHRGDADVIRGRTYDNPYLDPAYIEEMKKAYTDEEIKAYIHGEFIRFEGAWFHKHPPVLPYQLQPNGVKIFVPPEECSNQVVIGCDTAGGLGRDRSAVVVIDKRDERIVASWVSAFATIKEMCDVIVWLDAKYTKRPVAIYQPYLPVPAPSRPYIVVEVDGIGRATWQDLSARPQNLILKDIRTREWSRYSGLLAVKRAVEERGMAGPEELTEEARELYAEDQKFRGKKDLSMAIGFCLNAIASWPYEKPMAEISKETLNLMAKIKPQHPGGWK